MHTRYKLSIIKKRQYLYQWRAGLSNANRLVIDTPVAHMVIIYISINILSERLYRDTRPPNMAGQYQRFLYSYTIVLLIHYTPKSYNLLILIQVVFIIAPQLRSLDYLFFYYFVVKQLGKANSSLVLNQQIKQCL